ncbi:MAG: GntR family transcriptional regulator [Planctomycetota bacterium]|jgi:DNA-binding transcriptional regulator YhcF (GntR family)
MKKHKDPYRKNPKFKEISDAIKKDILNGKYAVGDKLPGVVKLGTLYKSSAVTANRALGILEAQGLVKRDARSGTYVSSTTEPLKKVLVVMSEKWNKFDPQLIYYLNGALHEAAGMGIEVCIKGPESSVFSSSENLLQTGAQGMILWGQSEDSFPLKVISETKLPKVAIGFDLIDTVCDMVEGMINDGAESIAFIGDKNKPNHRISCDGYGEALKKSKKQHSPMVYNANAGTIESTIKNIFKDKKNRPDSLIIPGIVCLRVIALLWEMGIFVRIGGFRETSLFDQLKGRIWLADLNHFELGRRAVQILANLVSGENKSETILVKAPILSPG